MNALSPGLSASKSHSQGVLYDNLLGANMSPQALPRLAILGNSFATYAERWSGPTHTSYVPTGRGFSACLLTPFMYRACFVTTC
jgi:hypothetical protein